MSALGTRCAAVAARPTSAPRDIGRRYGRVTGDLNPIHLSALSARLFGFRRAIAHGMWTKARALAALMPRASVGEADGRGRIQDAAVPAGAALAVDEPRAPAAPALFEVRDARGDKPHLRGRLDYRARTA